MKKITIQWPDGHHTTEEVGSDWLATAAKSGVQIPTGCLGGSCGACEIEVNNIVVRACISKVPATKTGKINVDFACDPFW